MVQRLVRDMFVELLEQMSVKALFGNPGTTEVPIIDGCAGGARVYGSANSTWCRWQKLAKVRRTGDRNGRGGLELVPDRPEAIDQA